MREELLQRLLQRRSKADRDDAFNEFVSESQDRLYSYLARRLRQGSTDVQDALQETLFAVYRDLDQFQGDVQGFGAWVYSIARNRARESERQRRRTPLRVAHEADDDEVCDEKSLGPATAVDREESMARLRELLTTYLERLHVTQAEAIRKRFLEGLDVEQASRVLGVSPGACSMRIMRGLRKLGEFPELQSVAHELRVNLGVGDEG